MRGVSETVRYDWGKITTPGPCSTWGQEHQCGQALTPIAGPGRLEQVWAAQMAVIVARL